MVAIDSLGEMSLQLLGLGTAQQPLRIVGLVGETSGKPDVESRNRCAGSEAPYYSWFHSRIETYHQWAGAIEVTKMLVQIGVPVSNRRYFVYNVMCEV